jgi:hypothetical protein
LWVFTTNHTHLQTGSLPPCITPCARITWMAPRCALHSLFTCCDGVVGHHSSKPRCSLPCPRPSSPTTRLLPPIVPTAPNPPHPPHTPDIRSDDASVLLSWFRARISGAMFSTIGSIGFVATSLSIASCCAGGFAFVVNRTNGVTGWLTSTILAFRSACVCHHLLTSASNSSLMKRAGAVMFVFVCCLFLSFL